MPQALDPPILCQRGITANYKQKTLERINNFYARSLGCTSELVENPESDIFVRRETTDYSEDQEETDIDIFVRDNEKIISCNPGVLPKVQKLEKYLPELKLSEESLEEKGLEVDEVLGPAFLSFADEESLRPVESDCRKLTEEDEEQLEKLKEEGDDEEVGDSIVGYEIGNHQGFGKFVGGELVAVSCYEAWDDEVAFIGVFVSEKYRGKGFGKEVVSKVAEDALEKDLIACYRTLEKWQSSVNLAKSLVFEKYANTYLVKLEDCA